MPGSFSEEMLACPEAKYSGEDAVSRVLNAGPGAPEPFARIKWMGWSRWFGWVGMIALHETGEGGE